MRRVGPEFTRVPKTLRLGTWVDQLGVRRLCARCNSFTRVTRFEKERDKMRRTIVRLSVLTVVLPVFVDAAFGADPAGTAFTYQGHLKQGGVPVTQTCSFGFGLWDDPVAGGPPLVLTRPAVEVVNGLFTVDLDFGSEPFDGDGRWLEIWVCCPGPGDPGGYCSSPPTNFTLVGPRQELTPVPYALYAGAGGDPSLWKLNGTSVYYKDGKVGIGTSDPGYNLEVVGSSNSFRVGNTNSWLRVSTGGNTRLSLGDGAGNEAGYILGGHNASGDNVVKISGCTDAGSCPTGTTFLQNGNVGIGTSTPDAKLHVTGSTRPVILAETSSTSSSAFAVEGVVTSTTPGGYSTGVRGINNSTTGNGIGVYGSQNGSGWGVYGLATSGRGVYGNSTSGTGIYGYSMNGDGVRGSCGSSAGWAGHFVNSSSNGGALYAQGSGAGRDEATLRVNNTEPTAGMAAYMTSSSTWATMHVQNDGAGETLWLVNNGGGHIIVAKTDDQWRFWVDGDGITHARVLEIHGGADLSEGFDVRGLRADRNDQPDAPSGDVQTQAQDRGPTGETPTPGMVVAIDPKNPGKLVVSTESYDRKVAGIISGAGGVNPGMLMGQSGSEADGDYPVALTGRVRCLCAASNGPIQPGDLLTTSDTPGHAMKVTDYTKAQGAIIGKAMTTLETGRGLVLVLVSLQ